MAMKSERSEIDAETLDEIDASTSQKEADEAREQRDVVDWDGPDDPQNPQNWPAGKKWTIILIISAVTFNQYACFPRRLRGTY